MKYMLYNNKVILSEFLGYITWTSLSTFTVVSKNSIGIENIPIFETLIFISGLVGIKVAHSEFIKYKTNIILEIVLETIFLIGIYYMLFLDNMVMAGICVYIIIILNAITTTINIESSRRYEDRYLHKRSHKKLLAEIRTKKRYVNTIGGTVGTCIALVCLTYFKMDIVLFTKLMLILNVLRNMYDYLIWNKYL